ncbi:MAG: metalloregulator ArsR/SmtB family transcription factor [Saprospiraceae bacterium]
MDKRAFKDKVYTVMAKLIKAMANPHRLEIIDILSQSERSVEEIADQSNMSVANASQHLQVLKAVHLVHVRRNGNFIYYRLASDHVYRSWKDLRAIGMETLPEIDKLMKDFRSRKNMLEPITLEDLRKRMQTKNVVLLDIRPEQEYEAGHIPDAINIPIEQLKQRIPELKKSGNYIAYCRGPLCVFADDAVQLLTKQGFKARRLMDGYLDWKLQYSAQHL